MWSPIVLDAYGAVVVLDQRVNVWSCAVLGCCRVMAVSQAITSISHKCQSRGAQSEIRAIRAVINLFPVMTVALGDSMSLTIDPTCAFGNC